MNIPVFSLNADYIQKYTPPVVRKYEVEYYLYVHIPEELCKLYKLFQVDSIAPKHCTLPMNQLIQQECFKPWIRINTAVLDLSIGLHTYKLSMVNTLTNDVVSIYFGYIIQDDDPDKPYVYMKSTECEVL